MRHRYQSEQWLPYPVDLVFAFFANPENLPRLMPRWQQARIEEAAFAPPPPKPPTASPRYGKGVAAGAGTRMTISFRAFPLSPLRIPWEAEITEFAWNDHFCDRQLRGPFAYWHHCHSVRAESRPDETSFSSPGTLLPGTLLKDEVEYEAPLGRLGEVANVLFISRQLRSTFHYRHIRTQELLARLSQGTSGV